MFYVSGVDHFGSSDALVCFERLVLPHSTVKEACFMICPVGHKDYTQMVENGFKQSKVGQVGHKATSG